MKDIAVQEIEDTGTSEWKYELMLRTAVAVGGLKFREIKFKINQQVNNARYFWNCNGVHQSLDFRQSRKLHCNCSLVVCISVVYTVVELSCCYWSFKLLFSSHYIVYCRSRTFPYHIVINISDVTKHTTSNPLNYIIQWS